jgi:2-polyprenyl-3-methyl-5-hydroxy-6-metoxy-1,4-benzoquinol methylase
MIRARPGFMVVQCTQCGLRRLDPLPSQQELKKLYEDDSLKHEYIRQGSTAYVAGSERAEPFIQDRLKAIAAACHCTGRILDVGAAQGSFLYEAKQLGWEPLGLELSPEGIQWAKDHYDVELRSQTLIEAVLPPASFDAVHLSHVLEHLPDPVETLAELRRILKPGGVIAIEVPNEFDDLFQLFRTRMLRRQPAPYAVPSPHVYFYTPETLRRLLVQNGFDVFHIETPRRDISFTSQILLGGTVRRFLFWLERVTKTGPNIEVYATVR